MSYEGYTQNLCANGHGFHEDAHAVHHQVCGECGAPGVWCNPVDETNCESYGEIDLSPFIISAPKPERCNLGHEHQGAYVYRIPTPAETEAARCWRPEFGGTPLVPIKR